jgi:hypothetical protein
MAGFVLDSARRRAPILKAGAAPHAGPFSLLAQRKGTKRKGPRRLAPCRWQGVPCASRIGRRSLNCLGPSMALALRAPQAATIGLLPDLSLAALGQTTLACLRPTLRCSAASTGWGRTDPATEYPGPLGAAEHRRQKTDQREDCLTDRREGVPQRPFSAEARRAVGAQRRPSLGVPFSLPSFFWASKRKKGWRAEPSAFKNI